MSMVHDVHDEFVVRVYIFLSLSSVACFFLSCTYCEVVYDIAREMIKSVRPSLNLIWFGMCVERWITSQGY